MGEISPLVSAKLFIGVSITNFLQRLQRAAVLHDEDDCKAAVSKSLRFWSGWLRDKFVQLN